MENKLDKYHYHEALDRTDFVIQILDVLGAHPVFAQHPEMRERIDHIGEYMGELYQSLGSLSFTQDD